MNSAGRGSRHWQPASRDSGNQRVRTLQASIDAVVNAIGKVQEDLRTRPHGPVPLHLRDSHYKGAAKLGHGSGYKYPHDYSGNYTPQRYVPEGAVSGPYYEPTGNGYEAELVRRLRAWEQAGEEDGLSSGEG